jgi:6-phosphogluconolactonase
MNAVRQPLIIGTYTPKRDDGFPQGMLAASYDGTGLTCLVALAELPNPSWVTATADGRYLYAVAERSPDGGVAAFARDPFSGVVTPLNTVPSGGAEPAHLELDPTERFAVVANYGSGSVSVFAREADGRLGAVTGHVRHQGTGVHPVRQASPHPHQACFDPVSGDLLVPDLGLDAVFRYRLDGDGVLTERRAVRLTGSPGSGPRHLIFHNDGWHLFVVNELDSTLAAYRRDGDGFARTCTVSTLPDGFTGHNQASAVRVAASGRSVLVANRGHDSIAVFAFDPDTGKLAPARVSPCGGHQPRDFVLTPDGTGLLVANQGSDTVTSFGFDEERACLRFVSAMLVPAPACLRWMPHPPAGSHHPQTRRIAPAGRRQRCQNQQ